MNAYPFEGWADTNLNVVRKYGAEALVWCFNVAHEANNPHCYFNMDKGTWHCFSCGFSGSLRNDPDAYTDEVQRKVLLQRVNKLMKAEEEGTVRTIPDTALARYRSEHNYWDRRNISKEMQQLFELGYDAISDSVTIPLRTLEGALIGVTRRFVDPEHIGPRYKYPKGFRASQNVFASWLYDSRDMTTVCITEGSIDAIRLWQQELPAVALYGAAISENHVDTMLKMGVQKVIYFGDGDKAGERAKLRAHGYWQRMDGSFQYKEKTDLSKHFLMFHIPTHFGKKDAGEMTDNEIVSAVDGAEFYMPNVSTKQKITKSSIQARLARIKRYN